MYIRDKSEERTSIQTHGALNPTIDCQCDVVMLYGLNEEVPERLKTFRDAGYRLQFMTGIAWGGYTDYLYGEWDGRDHWDEAQTDRWGNRIMHGKDTPYMCPTVSFADYLTEKLKKLVVDVDAVEAIYVEEPEFFLRGGYSEAFKREYRLYYGEDWVPPHESVDAFYRCSKLKAYLYARTIDRVGTAVKEYALQKYGRVIRFCVPTHSLINYTQWKIISPEGKLADIPCVDALISQTWTGTSREKTWYDGQYEERTFETAYLEYGAMQELVKGTGREMWFLHDPIEDNPIFDWDDYRKNYFCVVAASYLHPLVNKYEICPWPNRVFDRKYPQGSPDATYIPDDYATVISNVFNLSGTLETAPLTGTRVGVLCGDCELYQRAYPDCEYGGKAPEEETGTVIREKDELVAEIKRTVVDAATPDRERLLDLMASSGFPGFFSLANPLLIYGVPIRPVLLDNVRRYVGYLDDYDVLVLSYEYMKPDYPDVNAALAEWVQKGGVLIYVGDGFDPYHGIRSWWTGKYANPAEHLFSLLGVTLPADREITAVGSGVVGVWNVNPVTLAFGKEGSDGLRAFVTEAAARKGLSIEFKNYLDIRRGNLLISACLEHSVSDEPKVYTGRFADMFTPDFALTNEKRVVPGERSVLFDLDTIADEDLAVIGTSVRFLSMSADRAAKTVTAQVRGIAGIHAAVRLKVPFAVTAADVDGNPCTVAYDADSQTVLLRFQNTEGAHTLTVRG